LIAAIACICIIGGLLMAGSKAPGNQAARETRDLDQFKGKKCIVLSFDDGPYAETTPKLLDELETRNAKATFFLQGQWIEAHPDIVQKMYAEGNTVGNHTYDHQSITALTDEQLLDEYNKTQAQFWKLGIYTPFFRPPGGLYTEHDVDLLPNAIFVLWDGDPSDWATWDYETTYQYLITAIQNGATIIDLHDKIPSTTDAAIDAIDYLQPLGYAFISLEEAGELGLVNLDTPGVINALN